MDPNDVLFALHVANAFDAVGDASEARQWLRKALEIDPDNPAAWFTLANIVGEVPDEQTIAHLETIPSRRSLVGEEAAHWHFAIGRILDRLGRYDDAWSHFDAGNAVLRETRPFDDTVDTHHVDAVLRCTDAGLFERRRSVGHSSRLPIFIVGFPGSGTTLVEQIIASHPTVRGGGEQVVMLRAAVALTEHAPTGASYVEILDSIESVVLERAVADAAAAYRAAAGSAQLVTDKLPGNCLHVGLIRLFFPNAPIVHVRRDAVDVCVTNYLRMYSHGHHYSNDLTWLGKMWSMYERVMDHWRVTVPSPPHEIEYADLVADQEPVTRRILDHCGLPWDDRCLSFHETRRAVHTASRQGVRKGIYGTSVGGSQRFRAHLDELLDALDRGAQPSARGRSS